MTTKVEQWKGRKKGDATLPSGTEVKIEIPNLPEMVREGQVPNPLVKFATEVEDMQMAGESLDLDKIKEATDFMRWLIATTCVEPKIEPADVPALPTEDADMILEFALRARQVDAVGHQLHGLEKLADWRRFHLGPAT